MQNSARYLGNNPGNHTIWPSRFNRTTACRLIFEIGAVSVVAGLIFVRPGPAKESNAVKVAQAGPFALPSAASTSDPSPFSYLEFDWVGTVPGFGPIESPP